MTDFFRAGGYGMFPTLVFGLLMVAVGILYATRPERRYVPLLIALGMMTLAGGSLGFVTGFIKSLSAAADYVPTDRAPLLAMKGTAESLCNLALALGLVTFATIAAAVGALRLARSLPDRSTT